MGRRKVTIVATLLTVVGAGTADASRNATLRGSPAAMLEQNTVAKEHGLRFYRTSSAIHEAVLKGELVHLKGNADYDVASFVGHPYTQPETRVFVERLARDYHAACGQKLVVTSAVRPSSGQPRNAHKLSVHPAGMAVDLRVSDRASCRVWIEDELMRMESLGLLNGIRERTPPHYHVAIFPEPYMAYATERMAEEAIVAAAEAEAAAEEAARLAAAAAAAAVPPITPTGANGSKTAVPLAATLLALIALPIHRAMRGRRRTD
jgi:hypothetical protein